MKTILAAAPLAALLGTAAMVSLAAPAGAAADGATLFKQRCAMCHSGGPAGPELKGVYGRKAAAGEFRYSPALAKSKITWSATELDAYLASPGKKVPGTRMAVGVTDAAQRKAIIDYLKSR